MKFEYIKQASSIDPARPWIARPIIPISLRHKAMDIGLYALLDSGARVA
jgi:hypothetical protein